MVQLHKMFVYKIVSKEEPQKVLYVGSTRTTIETRWGAHKSHNDQAIHTHMLESGGASKFEIKLLQVVNGTKTDLRKAEEAARQLHNPPYNKCACIRAEATREEYFLLWLEKNKYRTCECGCVVVRNQMARHKRTNKHKQLLNNC